MTVRSWIGMLLGAGLVLSSHVQAANEPDDRAMAVDMQWRLRVESWNDFAFGASNDSTFVLNRLLAGFNAKVDDHTRVYLQGEIAVSTERDLPGGRRTLDAEELDLQQGYVEWSGAQKTQVRVGRHALKFGSQRLISPLAWSNTQRSWDGVVAKTQIADVWEATGFWTQYAPVQKFHFNDPDAQMPLWGVYLEQNAVEGQLAHDLYWIGSESAAKTFNGTAGPQRRHTIGGRMHGPIAGSNFDMDLEAAIQTGHVGSADVNAHMLAVQLGHRPAGSPATRCWVGVDYASGDSSPGGDVETFDHLFPLGHAYLGQIDVVGRQNVIDVNGGVSAKVSDAWSFSLAGHYFHRADSSDALYNAGGGVVRAGGLGSSKEIGAEIDLILNHQIDSSASCQFGYGHFFAGDFISESGSSSDIDFVYLSYLLKF